MTSARDRNKSRGSRREVIARDALARQRFDPFRLDARGTARKKARRFDELRREHPFRRLLRKARARVQIETQATHALETIAFLAALPDVGQEARQQRLVQLLVTGRVEPLGKSAAPFEAL